MRPVCRPETLVRPLVKAFFEPRTSSVQYVVTDPLARTCAIIDPVLDFDPSSGNVATHSADELLAFVEAEQPTVD